MDELADEEEMSMELSVDGGAIGRPGSQPGPSNPRPAESMVSCASTMLPTMTDTTSRTIIIEDVPATHEESLKDFLENRGKGGGRVELFERDHLNAKDMIVMFAHHNAVENMLRLGTVTIVGVKMKISSPTSMQIVSPSGNQSDFDRLRDIRPASSSASSSLVSIPASLGVTSMSDDGARTIVIKGVPDKYRQSLKDYLVNPENGGGRMVSFDPDRTNSRNMVAVFAHRKAAESMLSLGTIMIIDTTMTISRPGPSSEDSHGVPSDTVKVSNIPPKVTESMLKMYLELKKRSGGGPIRDFHMKPDKRQARIKFENADDAAEVAKRETHQLAGGFFDAVLLESDPAEGTGGCRAIRVSGIDRYKMSRDVISLYFENASHGDDITDLYLDQDVAVITFATPEAVKHVLSKKKHVLEDIRLRVEAVTPCSPPPLYVSETERNRLIVKGLPFGITLAKLSEFVDCEAGCGVTGWALGLKKKSAMLEFDGEPDYAALRRLVTCVPFSGRMVKIQRVPLTTCVQVDGLSDKDTDASVVTYFEGKAGVTRGTIQFDRKTKTSVVLKFPKHSALASVLFKHHVLNDHTLTLSPFSKELGCVLPDKLPEDPPDNWIPKSTEVAGSEEQLQYIQNNEKIRERVERTIAEVNCAVSWPTGESGGAVRLEQIERGDGSEDQEWSELCTGAFTSLLTDIVTRKLVAAPEVLWRLKARVEGETSDDVRVTLDSESSEMHIMGFSDSVLAFYKKLLTLKSEVEKQLEKEEEMKKRKVEVLATLRPPQIRYFQQCGVADEVTKRFANLNLRVDEQIVQLEGAEEILTDAKLFIYDSISQIESRFLDLSQDLTELIASEPTKTYVNDYLKQYKIRAIIEEQPPGKNGVSVHAIGQEEIQRASAFLTTDFVAVELKLDDAARHAVQSPDWQVLVEGLKQDYRFFQLRPGDDVLVVSGRKDLVEGILRKIRGTFEKHVTVETFVSMKPTNAQLIGTFRKQDVETLEKKLMASAMGGKLKQVVTQGDVSGFALKGNPEEVEAAKKQLEGLVKSATETTQEISRPGVVRLTENPTWTEFLHTVEQTHPVILKTTVTNPYDPSNASDVKSGPRHRMDINGHSIIVMLGEITDIPDGGALINPTNPSLELLRGLGLEIVKLGGEVIKEQCDDHIKKSGNLLPGSIFVSEAGRMLCDVIIHVVEPTTFDDQAVNVYQSSIEKALEEALGRRLQFVAFPLSFGAAFKREVLFATIKQFFEKPESAGLKSVQFVDDNVEQLKKLEDQLKEYGFSQTSTGSPPTSPQHPPTPSSPSELKHTTPEGIVVKFYKGTICALQVDVIVNSTAKNLVLGNGGVSKAILSGAGPEIQAECQQKAPNGLSQFGDIITTKAYKLSCKVVYHGAALQWDNGAGPAEKVLRTFASNALVQAHKQNMKSIAIPAIGSGTLKVPHDIVVNVLMNEIFKFSKTNPGTSLRTIYMVAYEQNQPSVAAFENKFMGLQPVPGTTPMKRQDFGGVTLKGGRLSLVDFDTTSGEDGEPDQSETEFSIVFDVASRYNKHKRNVEEPDQSETESSIVFDVPSRYYMHTKNVEEPDQSETESSIVLDVPSRYNMPKRNVDEPDQSETESSSVFDVASRYNMRKRNGKRMLEFESSDENCDSGEEYVPPSKSATEEENSPCIDNKERYSEEPDDPTTSKNVQNREMKKRKSFSLFGFKQEYIPSSDVEERENDEKYSKKSDDSTTSKRFQNSEKKYTRKGIYDFEDFLSSSDVEEKSMNKKCSKKSGNATTSRRFHNSDTKLTRKRIYTSSSEDENTGDECFKRPAPPLTSKTIQNRQKKKKIRINMSDSEEDYKPSSKSDEEEAEESADEKVSKKQNHSKIWTKIEIRQTTNTKTKRSYDKRHYCLFCDEPFAKITTHWSAKHSREPEVREICTERDEKKRLCLMTVLRNKGDHIHNCNVIKKGRGELVVFYRSKENKGLDDYRPCEYCLGYYSKKELVNHKCKVEPMKKRRMSSRTQMILPSPYGASRDVQSILNGMSEGPVKEVIGHDKLLQRLASKLFMRHGHEKKDIVRARLREMGRLMIEVQKFKHMENATLEDCLKPRKFKTVIRAVRALAGFNRDEMTYERPSIAIKVGHTLRKCCAILKGMAIESDNKQVIEDARRFDDLCESEWSDEVAFRAKKELYDRQRNSTKRLPLTADTKKLVEFLKSEIKSNKEELMTSLENKISDIWRHLAEVALVYLIIFNRRRQGEVSKIKMVEFNKAKCGSSNADVESCLSKLEQQLCRLFYRVEISGKRGRTVPLLMDTNMFETLSLLNRRRLEAGVLEDNPFVFAYNKNCSLSYIRGSDCLRKFSVDCGATYPETLRSTSLRKHVATMSQLMSLKDNQLDMLAQYMGHDIRTHREFYRLPEDTLQLAKLSKLFLIMEKGNVKDFSGKCLDNVLLKMNADSDLEPDDEVEDDDATDVQSNEDECSNTTHETEQVAIPQTESTKTDNQDNEIAIVFEPLKGKKKRTQRRWSEKEKDAVMKHMMPDIIRKKVPRKEGILLCMKKERCLAQRTWRNIRDFCRNAIVQARYA